MSEEGEDVLEEPWGQLVSAGDAEESEEERVPLLGERFLIGRNKDAELAVAENRLVSSRHCLLERDEEGRKWVTDCSTNGTLLNGARLQKYKRMRLRDGNVISVVFRRDDTDCNVVYRFTDLSPLETDQSEGGEEAGEGGEDDNTLDLTLEGDTGAVCETSEGVTGDGGEGRDTGAVCETSEGGEGRDTGAMCETSEGVTGDGGEGRGYKRRLSEREGTPEVKRPALEGTADQPAPSENKDEEKGVGSGVAGLVKTGSIEQTLICQICQELFHDCISHACTATVEAATPNGWTPPTNALHVKCRRKVERVNKNHLVNNLVDAFLRANPEKKRPEEDLKDLDKKNKITRDMLYPKRCRYDWVHWEYESDTDQSEDSTSSQPNSPALHQISSRQRIAPSFGQPIPGRFVCRQCPTYAGVPPPPPPPTFTCSPTSTNHILCQCCLQPMPDHRTETDTAIPPQKCDLCNQAFCHMYWGCTRVGCIGCLSRLKDAEFSHFPLSSIINDNIIESSILMDCLASQSKTVQDMLNECCSKLDSGEFHCTDSGLSSSSVTCLNCALRSIKELVYQFRSNVPTSDLPESVRRRRDCHWGKNCRTQKHNVDHARRYNHICEQTRTS